MTVNDPQDIYKEPRTVLLEKTDTGFGFNVRGQVNEGGQLKVCLLSDRPVLGIVHFLKIHIKNLYKNSYKKLLNFKIY